VRLYSLIAVAVGLFVWPSKAVLVAAFAGAATFLAAQAAVRAWRRRAANTAAAGQGVTLGVDGDGHRVVLTDWQLSAHGLILGASGAGKSTTLLAILTDQIRRGRSVVAIDMKGSPAFAAELERAAAGVGRPFRLWTLDGPGYWNPLAHGNPTELKDKLITTERFTEPHYQRAAERYLQTVMQVLAEVHPGRPPELADVVKLMDPRRLSRLLRDTTGPLAERVQDYVGSLTPDQLSAIRGLGTRLAIVSESHTGEFLADRGADTIDLRRALSGPEVVVFSLNSSTYGRLSAQVGSLVVQDLVAAAGHRLTHGVEGQAMIGIDEFSALDSDNVIALLVRGRASGVPVLVATQEFADLERAGRGVRDQVSGVTAVKIAHRQDVPDSARMIAEMVGTERVWEQSHHTRHRLLLGERRSGRGLVRQVERYKIDPNTIKSLRVGEAVVITKLPQAEARTVRITPRAPSSRPTRKALERGGPEL
jgi:type IV secretory pathway TraG/TraD family ATPase VirD4